MQVAGISLWQQYTPRLDVFEMDCVTRASTRCSALSSHRSFFWCHDGVKQQQRCSANHFGRSKLLTKSIFMGDCGRIVDGAMLECLDVRRECQSGKLEVFAYAESNNPMTDFLNKARGALPIVGLITRLMSDDGGVGSDRLRYLEFCRRVEKAATPAVSRAFVDFAERHGKAAKPSYILLWCWAAAVGAGLLRSEDIMAAAGRLRFSHDTQYEVDTFDILMEEGIQRRAKAKKAAVDVPIVSRAEKALQAICKCCINSQRISRDDGELLVTILSGVFLTLEKEEAEQLVAARIAADEELGDVATEESEEEGKEVKAVDP